jgi:hypothetical protein
MELAPADARAAPSAAQPADMDQTVPASPKRQRPTAQPPKVSQRASQKSPGTPENQTIALSRVCLSGNSTSQSLAHHTTLMGRCLKSALAKPSPGEELSHRSTYNHSAERHQKTGLSCEVRYDQHTSQQGQTYGRPQGDTTPLEKMSTSSWEQEATKSRANNTREDASERQIGAQTARRDTQGDTPTGLHPTKAHNLLPAPWQIAKKKEEAKAPPPFVFPPTIEETDQRGRGPQLHLRH